MARKLINIFREHYKLNGNNDWFNIVTDPYALGDINDRFGNLLYNKSIDRVASIDDVGAAITPIIALSDLMSFSIYKEDTCTLYPEPKAEELIAILCEKLNENNLSSINTLSRKYSIVLVGTLIHLDDTEIPMRHVYLYDKEKLDN